MGKNLTEVIEETIEFIKDKRTPQQMASTPNIHIENTESPKFTVWMNCANYIMPDYLWMASEIKNNDGNYRKNTLILLLNQEQVLHGMNATIAIIIKKVRSSEKNKKRQILNQNILPI